MSSFVDTIKHHPLVLVDLFTTWCEPCKKMKVILKEIDAEIQGSTPIMEVNLEKNPLLARKFQVQTVPTLLLFKKGKLVWKQSGVVPPATIKQVLKKHA